VQSSIEHRACLPSLIYMSRTIRESLGLDLSVGLNDRDPWAAMGHSSGKRLHVDNELSTPPTRALVEEFDGLQMSVQGQLLFAAHERWTVGSGNVPNCDESRRFRLIKLAETMQKQ
jgi:hypothetical protein